MGQRKWIDANGKTDPQGTFYIQFYKGSKTQFECLKDVKDFHEAELALLRFERKLKAASQGFVLPEEPTVVETKNHRHQECIASYEQWLGTTKKKNGRGYTKKSIKERVNELVRLVAWCPVRHIEDITRKHLIGWRDYLYAEDYPQDTVLNKLATVVSWMKRNQTVRITGLLMAEDWPERRVTAPRPFSEQEIEVMMTEADLLTEDGKYRLILRLFHGSGIRIDELAHLERRDLTEKGSTITIRSKPKWNWEPKTVTSARVIPIGDGLMADLLAYFTQEGLLFPCETGTPYAQAIYRKLEEIGKNAGVQPPPDQPKADWCHRWRDTYATEQVRDIQRGKSQLGLRDIARLLGHSNLDTINVYAEFVKLESEEARAAANARDRFGKKPMLATVVSIAS